jgi:hypothetical protein
MSLATKFKTNHHDANNELAIHKSEDTWTTRIVRKDIHESDIPIPYDRVESWLDLYNSWKAKVLFLESQLSHIPGLTQNLKAVAIHGKGQKNEAVLNEVIKRLEITEQELPLLHLRIQLLEFSFLVLNPEERNFVKLRYINQIANSLAMDHLGLSRRAFYYTRKRILKKIYLMIKDKQLLLSLDSCSAQ